MFGANSRNPDKSELPAPKMEVSNFSCYGRNKWMIQSLQPLDDKKPQLRWPNALKGEWRSLSKPLSKLQRSLCSQSLLKTEWSSLEPGDCNYDPCGNHGIGNRQNGTGRGGRDRFIQHQCWLRGVTFRVWTPGLCSQPFLYNTGSYLSHVSSPGPLLSPSRQCPCLWSWASKVTEAKMISNAWSTISQAAGLDIGHVVAT